MYKQEKSLCKSLNSQSPTIQLVIAGTRISYKPSEDSIYEEYSIQSLDKFITTSIPTIDIIYNIRQPQQLTNYITHTCLSRKQTSNNIGFILFTSVYDTPVYYTTLAYTYKNKAVFSEVRASNNKLYNMFTTSTTTSTTTTSINSAPVYPSLYVVCGNTAGLIIYEKYKGNFIQYNELDKFIQSYINNNNICKDMKTNKKDEIINKYNKYVNYSEKMLMKLKINDLKEALEVLTLVSTNGGAKTTTTTSNNNDKSSSGITAASEGLLEKKDFVQAVLHAQQIAKAATAKVGAKGKGSIYIELQCIYNCYIYIVCVV